ncbi:unnamed protein product [Allacma fusca]|uniref:Uncharacterized protein n=1 Tax=Allacma fusca TaxID=39272 RepID=A0A8J2PCC4_9HEXA|nr:unnamed protein product [Allacma fusca]
MAELPGATGIQQGVYNSFQGQDAPYMDHQIVPKLVDYTTIIICLPIVGASEMERNDDDYRQNKYPHGNHH